MAVFEAFQISLKDGTLTTTEEAHMVECNLQIRLVTMDREHTGTFHTNIAHYQSFIGHYKWSSSGTFIYDANESYFTQDDRDAQK